MNRHIVIIGAGQAGAQAALTLREADFPGRITLIGEEAYPPYQRPPLSKAFLAGELARERLFFRPAEAYAKLNISLMLNTRVDAIERETRQILLQNGERLGYDRLLIATGTRARIADIPGAGKSGVFYLRSLDDSVAISNALQPGKKLAIIGGGYIGLEIAAIASKRGIHTTILEAQDRILKRVTAEPVAEFLHRIHQRNGVDIQTGTQIESIDGDENTYTIRYSRESRPGPASHGTDSLETDCIIIGIGAEPRVELAADAGLETDNGILVNQYAQTSDPNIFAAGDCTNPPNALVGENIRLESVQNAIEQAQTAALNLSGENPRYAATPWFWSDQYDIKLRIAGLSHHFDETVLRGNPDDNVFSLFYLRKGILVAVDTINDAPTFMAAKQLIAQQRQIPKDVLADTGQKLKKLGITPSTRL